MLCHCTNINALPPAPCHCTVPPCLLPTAGDKVARRYPNHGRIAVVQFSVGIGVPMALLLMKGLPLNGEPTTVAMYSVLLTFKGE